MDTENGDKRHKCLCDTHVRKGSVIVAVVSIVFAVFEMSCVWLLLRMYSVFPQIAAIVICVLIIVGDRAEKSWMYIPYLVLTMCGILSAIIVSIYLILLAIFLPDYSLEQYDDWPSSAVRSVYIFMFIVTFLSIFIYSYFWYVVFRAYKYMRDEIESKKFGVKTVVYSLPTRDYSNVPNYSQETSDQIQNI